MTGSVRIGVIGTSGWMDMAHLPMLAADPRVEMSAICGRNRERAQEMADKYGISQVFTDFREMYARGELDAVVIGAPDDEHCHMVMAALDAGLHVLCEKPLALNAADAYAMYRAAEERDVRHMTFFTFRWMPHYRYMRELLDRGLLGRLYHAQFSFLMGGGRDGTYQWRYDSTRASGNLGDLGAHMFDLARYLAGDIESVSAHLATHVARPGLNGQPLAPANDSAMALLAFANGAQGVVQVSAVAHIDDPILEQYVALHGEAGSMVAELKIGVGPRLRMGRGDEPFQDVTLPEPYWAGVDRSQPFITQFVPMYAQQPVGCRLFIDAILAGRSEAPTFYEGWKAQQLIDAAVESHAARRWVEVGESTREPGAVLHA